MDDKSVELGSKQIPIVVFELAKVVHMFDGPELESQLQSFDAFLGVLAREAWPGVALLLRQAAASAANPETRDRLEQAANDISEGRRPCPPYDHAAEMKRYQDAQRESFSRRQAVASPQANPRVSSPEPGGPERLVEHSEFLSFIAKCGAAEDESLNNKGGIGDVERWLDRNGRMVARVHVRYWHGENEIDYYVCD